MRWFRGHPGFRALNRFADGELGERAHAAVAGHLAGCARCREEVALIRRIGDAARALPTPVATPEMLERALARRERGERVLLPATDVGAPRRGKGATLVRGAVAALITVAIATLLVSVRVLEADRPALRVTPARPGPGERLEVAYHGGALFADQSRLKLRARYRATSDRPWVVVAGILVRADDGVYRTIVQLPDSVVHAAFAVESLGGDRVDSNNRRLWEVMIHGPDEEPTIDALTARVRDLQRRDWGGAYAQARDLTARFPESPQAWAVRFAYELSLFDRDSVFGAHRTRFRALERRLVEQARPDPVEMAWLGTYALSLGELASAETWIRGAAARAPGAPVVIDARVLLAGVTGASQPAELLPRIEALWKLSGGTSTVAANVGWQTARASGDADALRRWRERQVRLRPETEGALLADAARVSPAAFPALLEWASAWRPASVPDEWRPLSLSRAEYERFEEQETQGTLARAAGWAYEHGRTATAESLLARARELRWDSEAFLVMARLSAALGDGAGAATLLARAAADPMTEDRARRAAAEIPAAKGGAWEAAVLRAERALWHHVMEGAVIRYADDEVRLVGADGETTLASLTGQRVTVVAFLSRYCAPALEQLPDLVALAERLARRDARLILIDTENTGELADHVRRADARLAVYADPSGDARAAFRNAGTPEYFVMDAAGRIRFEHSRVGEIARQVQALQTAEAARQDQVAWR